MYEKLDNHNKIVQKYNTQNMKNALQAGNIDEVAKNLYNVFEIAVEDAERIKKEIIDSRSRWKFNVWKWL